MAVSTPFSDSTTYAPTSTGDAAIARSPRKDAPPRDRLGSVSRIEPRFRSPRLGIHRLGLPPFAYGAGLNLFSNALVGFFMRNLGAYTVDRSKGDPLYRQTLKEYATVLLEHEESIGRNRTETQVGLLGTVPVALRHGLEAGTPRRHFVVPCTLTYPLVLEAASLVDDFLRAEGRARYVDARDELDRPSRWFDFLRELLDLDLVIHVHFGKPMDVVGNDVDADGESLDPRGRQIDPSGYFSVAGSLSEDAQRDAEYTRMMAARLIASYRTDTVAVPTSVLAYAVFECLRRERAPA